MSDKSGLECKFVWRCNNKTEDDIHLAKIVKHTADGEQHRFLKIIKNYKRKVWVTKPNKRTHKDRREYEFMDNLDCFYSTQKDLSLNLLKTFNIKSKYIPSVKEIIADCPFIYGTEISSEGLIKHEINNKYNLKTKNSLASFDIETCVFSELGNIIIASTTYIYKDVSDLVLAYDKKWIKDIKDVEDLFFKAADKYIKEYIEKYNLKITLIPCSDEVEIIFKIFEKLHIWKPDFLSIWNMNFDIPKVLDSLERHEVDPKLILCDPNLPDEYKFCNYIKGASSKMTASGKHMSISPANQWHTLELAASFYVIDAMCLYRQLRIAKPEEPSYKLDSILEKNLGIRKLKFKEADKYQDLAWHKFMQTYYKIEYMVYNAFDSLSMMELELKNNDIGFSISVFAGNTPFYKFKSQPSRVVDEYHYFLQNENMVLGTIGVTKDEDESKYKILNLKNWILTLRADYSYGGLNVVKEIPSLNSYFRILNNDADLEAAYPTLTYCFNISINTTRKELCQVIGFEEQLFRIQNINFIFGKVNTLQYSVVMLGLPDLNDIYEKFMSEVF